MFFLQYSILSESFLILYIGLYCQYLFHLWLTLFPISVLSALGQLGDIKIHYNHIQKVINHVIQHNVSCYIIEYNII